MMTTDAPSWLSTTDAARLLGVSPDTVRRMCDKSYFPGAWRIGHAGHWHIPPGDVDVLRRQRRRIRRPVQ